MLTTTMVVLLAIAQAPAPSQALPVAEELGSEPEPEGPPRSATLPAWDDAEPPATEPASTPSPPVPRPPISGGPLLGGGAVACAIGSFSVAMDIQWLTVEPELLLERSSMYGHGRAAMPICLATVVPGAALRGAADGRRDRLAGTRQDVTPMARAGLGMAIAGPLITGLAVGGTYLIPYDSSRSRSGAGMPFSAMGASGFASFATGLSLIARARNYEAEFGRSAGIWAPRGWGSLSAAIVMGAGSLAIPFVAAQTDLRLIGVGAPLARLTFGSVLLGAIGGNLRAEWQRQTHDDGPRRHRGAKRALQAGISLVSLAAGFGVGAGIAALQIKDSCPEDPPYYDEAMGGSLWPGPDPLRGCQKPRRTAIAGLASLGLASLEIGAGLLGYARAWIPRRRHRVTREQSLGPTMMPGGFGLTWSGRM